MDSRDQLARLQTEVECRRPHVVDGKGDVDNDVDGFTGEMTRLSVLIDARRWCGLTKISRSFF